MKKIIDKLYKNIEIVTIFLISSILNVYLIINNCILYKNFNFDTHHFIFWQYAQVKNLLPYVDIFYPYGLLFYYKNQNIIFSLIFFLIVSTLLTFFYYSINKIIMSRIVSVIFYIFIFLSYFLTGMENQFIRYGIPLAMLIFYTIYIDKKNCKTKEFLFGIILGLTIFLFFDSGIYSYISILFFVITKNILNKFKKSQFINTFKKIFNISLGLAIGALPFYVFIISKTSLFSFYDYLINLSYLSKIAKVPFPPSLKNIDNIYVILGIILVEISLCLQLILKTRNKDKFFLLKVSVLVLIIILEQKNILRSISEQLIIYGIILYAFIIRDIKVNYNIGNKVRNLLILLVLIFNFAFIVINIIKTDNRLFIRANLNSIQCVDNNLNKIFSEDKDIANLINYINRKNIIAKIFSFPSDPFIYAFLNQAPPFYLSTYDGSTLKGQFSRIDYLNKNNVNKIILNTKNKSLQDSVPEYIRVPNELSYILNNYIPEIKIGKYLVLKKENKDFFKTEGILFDEYRNFLLNVNLSKIPYSEGVHKIKVLKNNNKIIDEYSVLAFNNYLKSNKISSKNKMLVIVPYNKNNNGILYVKTDDSISGLIRFDTPYKNEPYFINLSKVPLFYKDRVINEISLGNNFKGSITLYEIVNKGELW